jgi:translation initiation factor IF-2
VRGRKSKRAKRQEFEQMQAPSLGGVTVPRGDGKTTIRVRRGSSLTDFADKINANPASLVTVLFHLGEMATATQSLDEDTFKVLGAELGYDIQVVSPEEEEKELFDSFNIDLETGIEGEEDEDLEARPPVVTVVGHVDHGKTRLLDAIRNEDVVAGEAGGITQHIGAYQVHREHEGVERAITFIDTPGHEAFTAMRARGAKVTDIAVLVVAADDGVMPQTLEAIDHAKAAEVEIVVAVNKIDRPDANPERVRTELTNHGLQPTEWGGQTEFVDVSAKTGENLPALLELLLLQADVLDLKANPNAPASGVIIESRLDVGRGPVATLLVQRGTLLVGDAAVAGDAWGKVRALNDHTGRRVKDAQPGDPVEILGFDKPPPAGEFCRVEENERSARQTAQRRAQRLRAEIIARRSKAVSLEDLFSAMQEGAVQALNLIIKADVQGSVEAAEGEIAKIQHPEVTVNVIHAGVGGIAASDVSLAAASNAIVVGFNVRPNAEAKLQAEREGVDIRTYKVIYQLTEDIQQALIGMLAPEQVEEILGEAEVRQIFKVSRLGTIAGCMVTQGVIQRGAQVRIVRDGAIVYDGRIDSLKRFQDDAREVAQGFECGLTIDGYNDLKEGDVLEVYAIREVARTA